MIWYRLTCFTMDKAQRSKLALVQLTPLTVFANFYGKRVKSKAINKENSQMAVERPQVYYKNNPYS